MFVKLALVTFATLASAIIRDSYDPSNAVGCLRHITRREFNFNPKGFMVVSKTFNVSREADDVQNQYLKVVHESRRTALMSVGIDEEDIAWYRKRPGVTDESHRDDGDEISGSVEEDIFIQSHLFFIRLSDFYVVIIDGYRAYNSKIRQLVRVPSWNARAPMIVYCSKHTKTKKAMMVYPEHILHSLWSYHVMNAIVLIHDYRNRSVINAYSWNPYDPPKRCGEKHQSTLPYLKLYDTCINGTLQKKEKLFPNKIPKNLQKCPIKVLGVLWHPFLNHNYSDNNPGFDREVLNVIAERLNFTIDLDVSIRQWGDKLENGSWYGVFGGLKRSLGEVAIGAIYPDNDVHEDFDSTLSYLQDSYIWVVPRARQLPEWTNLVILFQPTMWIATGVVYLLCSFVWFALSEVPWELGVKLKGFVTSALDSWCMTLCASTITRPDSLSFRVYFGFFCLYGMIWCTAYQTKMITVFTNPTYERGITTIKQMLEAKLKFGGNEAFRFLFNNSIDSIEDYFYDNYLTLSVQEVLDHVIKYRNVSVLTTKMYVRYLSATTLHYNDPYGAPLFHVLGSKVFSFPIEMVTIKGFAFLGRFNEYISILKSNGLIGLFSNRFKEYAKRSAANLAIKADLQHVVTEKRLTVNHLQGAFLGLVLGNLLAAIVFIVELIIYRKSGKKQKQKQVSEEVIEVHGTRLRKKVNFSPKDYLLKHLLSQKERTFQQKFQ